MQVGDVYNPYRLFVGAFIPNWLLRQQDVSFGAKCLFGRLAQYAGETGVAFPSLESLAEELGRSPRQVAGLLAELVKVRLVRATKHGPGRPARYLFTWHEWAEAACMEGQQAVLALREAERAPAAASRRKPRLAAVPAAQEHMQDIACVPPGEPPPAPQHMQDPACVHMQDPASAFPYEESLANHTTTSYDARDSRAATPAADAPPPEGDPEPKPLKRRTAAERESDGRVRPLQLFWAAKYQKTFNVPYAGNFGREGKLIRAVPLGFTLDDLLSLAEIFWTELDPFTVEVEGCTLAAFLRRLPALAPRLRPDPTGETTHARPTLVDRRRAHGARDHPFAADQAELHRRFAALGGDGPT